MIFNWIETRASTRFLVRYANLLAMKVYLTYITSCSGHTHIHTSLLHYLLYTAKSSKHSHCSGPLFYYFVRTHTRATFVRRSHRKNTIALFLWSKCFVNAYRTWKSYLILKWSIVKEKFFHTASVKFLQWHFPYTSAPDHQPMSARPQHHQAKKKPHVSTLF